MQLRPTGVLETLRQLELLDNDENQLSRSLCHEELRKNLIEEIPSSIDVANSSQQDVELMSILSEREMSLADESDSELELIEDEGGETDSLSGFRFKSARKKLPQQSEMEMASKEEIRHLALESIREKYFTKDQNCRLSLKKSALKIVEVAPLPPGGLLRIHSDNKTNSNRRIFPCARALHVFENWVTPKTIEVLEHSSTEVEEISTRSQKDPKVAKMELMVKRFFQGEILQEQSDTDDESNKEVILPLVDSCDQRVERRNIVLDRMNVV